MPGPGNNGLVVLLDLTIARQVVRSYWHIFDPKDPTQALEKPECELLSIVQQQDSRRIIDHDPLDWKCDFLILGCDKPKKNGMDKFRETIWHNKEIFVVLRGCQEFPQDVNSNKLEQNESGKNLLGLERSSWACCVGKGWYGSCTDDATSYCCVTVSE